MLLNYHWYYILLFLILKEITFYNINIILYTILLSPIYIGNKVP